jgi:hypothetical protein
MLGMADRVNSDLKKSRNNRFRQKDLTGEISNK